MKVKLSKLNKKNEVKIKNLVKIYLKEITKKKEIKLDDLNNFINKLKKKTHFFWIYDGNIKIGFVSMYFNLRPANLCYIRDFFITKKYRGKRRGTLVFKKIKYLCKKKKLKKIKLHILKTNKKVEKFWLSIGFKKKLNSYFYIVNNDSN